MSKRKNPFTEENASPTKKRKIDSCNNNNCTIRFTATQNAKLKEKSFSINSKKNFKVGRDPSKCAIVFTETPMVSRIHCEFIIDNNHKLFCKDLKSTNGVFINNTKIDKQGTLTQVNNNDIIRFGKNKTIKNKNYNHEYKVEIILNATLNNDNNATISNSSLSLTEMSSASLSSNGNIGGSGSGSGSGSLVDIQAILQQTVKAQLAEHTKKMEAKLAAKDAENAKIKQKLHEKEMKELALKAKQQKEELERKQQEVEAMKKKMEIEKEQNAKKLELEKQKIEKDKKRAIEETKRKQKAELAKMKQKEEETKRKLSNSAIYPYSNPSSFHPCTISKGTRGGIED